MGGKKIKNERVSKEKWKERVRGEKQWKGKRSWREE